MSNVCPTVTLRADPANAKEQPQAHIIRKKNAVKKKCLTGKTPSDKFQTLNRLNSSAFSIEPVRDVENRKCLVPFLNFLIRQIETSVYNNRKVLLKYILVLPSFLFPAALKKPTLRDVSPGVGFIWLSTAVIAALCPEDRSSCS